MKKIIFSLLLLLCFTSSKAQTDAAMLTWLSGHSSAIDLSKSTLVGYNTGVKITGPINKLEFTKFGIEAVKSYSSSSSVKVILTRFYFTKAKIENEMLLLFADGSISVFSLHIGDEAIRLKYKEVFTRFAYTRLNTNETDMPIYEIDKVDSKAVFPNDVDGWKKLIKGYDFDPAFKYNVPAGTYEGKISFVVTKDSLIKDFKKDGNSPRGINEMMLVLITKMPKWIPAKRNGQNVSSFVTIKVNLVVPVLTNSFEDQMWKLEAQKYIDKNCNISNYDNGNPGYIGLKPLMLDDNSTTLSPSTKNDTDVKQPVVVKTKTDIKLEKWITEPVAYFTSIGKFSDGLATVSRENSAGDDRWGYINKDGKIVVPLKYEEVMDFSNGLACVTLNNKRGFINKVGKVVVPFIWDDADPFSEGLAVVKRNYLDGCIDTTGKIVLAPKFAGLHVFHEGLIAFKGSNEEWGYVDRTGKVIIEPKYSVVWGNYGIFHNGLSLMTIYNKSGSKSGFVTKDGREAISFIYDDAHLFSEGLACVEINKKYGYINKEGKTVIPFDYDYAYSFVNGLAQVKLQESYGIKERYGIINTKGAIVAPIRYQSISNFVNGIANVKLGGKEGFIDEAGKEIIAPKYDETGASKNGLMRVSMNGRWGYIDLEGNITIPLIYDQAYDFIGGLAKVRLNGKTFIIDRSGNKWVAPK